MTFFELAHMVIATQQDASLGLAHLQKLLLETMLLNLSLPEVKINFEGLVNWAE